MWEYKYPITSDELYHYGVKGMKWGVRRYQNKDGTLTDVGKRRAQNVRSEARLISTTDGYILKKRHQSSENLERCGGQGKRIHLCEFFQTR